ncbi:hypothetical protein [Burkholderia pseudomallei]|uniref:hypothetical protein n=1 Tax=Burkholderia pseudomallei TaxID=28450 RepID=UPI00065A8B1A|nr:hypothetical protein [Burkholderia pseudomallei]CRY18686.1 Uncharacterised protein [Burkholderia pseudomallei]
MLSATSVNWREVLFDLRRLGLMPTNVARELRGAVSERQVRDYTEQLSEPSHVRGELILDLWCEKTGKGREDAPRRPHERI